MLGATRLGPLLALLLCGFGQPRLMDTQLGTLSIGPAELARLAAIRLPVLSAQGAVVIDYDSGMELFNAQADRRLRPASTTKMMTALLTLEAGNLDAMVTVSAAAAAIGGSSMRLEAGDELSVRELLPGLLLPSGNDAAVALAEHGAPTLQAWVNRMNARAAQLGMRDTHFTNPHGLDENGHLSTAADLARLARFELRTQPLFRALVSTAEMTLPAAAGHRQFALTNLNQLLTSYPGADGVKTGTTLGAKQALVASATRGQRLLAVVLFSDDRYSDARQLLDYGFTAWSWLPIKGLSPLLDSVSLPPTGPLIVPAWEASQVVAFVDADTAKTTFSLAQRELLTVPTSVLPGALDSYWTSP